MVKWCKPFLTLYPNLVHLHMQCPAKANKSISKKPLTVSHAAQSVYTSTQDAGLTVQSPPFLHGLDEHSSTSVSQFNP